MAPRGVGALVSSSKHPPEGGDGYRTLIGKRNPHGSTADSMVGAAAQRLLVSGHMTLTREGAHALLFGATLTIRQALDLTALVPVHVREEKLGWVSISMRGRDILMFGWLFTVRKPPIKCTIPEERGVGLHVLMRR